MKFGDLIRAFTVHLIEEKLCDDGLTKHNGFTHFFDKVCLGFFQPFKIVILHQTAVKQVDKINNHLLYYRQIVIFFYKRSFEALD